MVNMCTLIMVTMKESSNSQVPNTLERMQSIATPSPKASVRQLGRMPN